MVKRSHPEHELHLPEMQEPLGQELREGKDFTIKSWASGARYASATPASSLARRHQKRAQTSKSSLGFQRITAPSNSFGEGFVPQMIETPPIAYQYNQYGFVRDAHSPEERQPQRPSFPQDFQTRPPPRPIRDNRDVHGHRGQPGSSYSEATLPGVTLKEINVQAIDDPPGTELSGGPLERVEDASQRKSRAQKEVPYRTGQTEPLDEVQATPIFSRRGDPRGDTKVASSVPESQATD